jgi:hypothetical protein
MSVAFGVLLYLPSGAGPGNHMEEVAWLGNFRKIVHFLDLRHDLIQDDEGRDAPNTPSICNGSAKVS